MKKTGAALTVLLLAFFGLADSAYLTQSETSGTPLLCNIQHLSGCNIVAQSAYAHFLGLSLAEWGLIFYGLLFFVAALELLLYRHESRRLMQVIAGFGFFASLYFTALQIFIIKALCVYCLTSAVLTVLIFIAAIFLEPIRRNRHANHSKHSFLRMPPLS